MFDALTIRAVADELHETILDGRVQRVGLTDERTLVLEIFAHGVRHNLLISDHPQAARVHLVSTRLTPDAERVTPFTLLLRKYVRGGRIVAIVQPALERTMALSIVKVHPLVKERDAVLPDEDDAPDAPDDPAALPPGWTVERMTLVVEIMGRHSNAVLVDAHGDIVDALKRVPPSLSRVRPILPHLPYAPPPPQEKADPRTVTAGQLLRLCAVAGAATPLATALVGSLRGVSPQAAREIAYRAGGDTKVSATQCDPDAVVTALHDFYRPLDVGGWQPVRYLQDGIAAAFSPVPLRLFTDDPTVTAETEPSISAVVSAFFADTGRAVAHGERRNRLLASIADVRARVDTRLASLRGELERAKASELLRQKGEAIYAAVYEIAPHQRELVTETGLKVVLDPGMSPSENAQQYFDQYRRAQRATEGLPELVAQTETSAGYLNQIVALAETATAFDDLVALENEWRDYTRGVSSSPAKPAKPAKPGRGGRVNKKIPRKPAVKRARAYPTPTGERILVGRSGPQNEHLTFTLSQPDDLWFHARGVGGAHVILQWAGGTAETQTRAIETAAQLAAFYSSAREAGRVEVDYAPRRQVRKIPGAGPGMVTYRGERSVRVSPASVEALTAEKRLRGERE